MNPKVLVLMGMCCSFFIFSIVGGIIFGMEEYNWFGDEPSDPLPPSEETSVEDEAPSVYQAKAGENANPDAPMPDRDGTEGVCQGGWVAECSMLKGLVGGVEKPCNGFTTDLSSNTGYRQCIEGESGCRATTGRDGKCEPVDYGDPSKKIPSCALDVDLKSFSGGDDGWMNKEFPVGKYTYSAPGSTATTTESILGTTFFEKFDPQQKWSPGNSASREIPLYVPYNYYEKGNKNKNWGNIARTGTTCMCPKGSMYKRKGNPSDSDTTGYLTQTRDGRWAQKYDSGVHSPNRASSCDPRWGGMCTQPLHWETEKGYYHRKLLFDDDDEAHSYHSGQEMLHGCAVGEDNENKGVCHDLNNGTCMNDRYFYDNLFVDNVTWRCEKSEESPESFDGGHPARFVEPTEGDDVPPLDESDAGKSRRPKPICQGGLVLSCDGEEGTINFTGENNKDPWLVDRSDMCEKKFVKDSTSRTGYRQCKLINKHENQTINEAGDLPDVPHNMTYHGHHTYPNDYWAHGKYPTTETYRDIFDYRRPPLKVNPHLKGCGQKINPVASRDIRYEGERTPQGSDRRCTGICRADPLELYSGDPNPPMVVGTNWKPHGSTWSFMLHECTDDLTKGDKRNSGYSDRPASDYKCTSCSFRRISGSNGNEAKLNSPPDAPKGDDYTPPGSGTMWALRPQREGYPRGNCYTMTQTCSSDATEGAEECEPINYERNGDDNKKIPKCFVDPQRYTLSTEMQYNVNSNQRSWKNAGQGSTTCICPLTGGKHGKGAFLDSKTGTLESIFGFENDWIPHQNHELHKHIDWNPNGSYAWKCVSRE